MPREQFSDSIPKSELEARPLINCSVINAEPSLAPELFDGMTKGAEYVIIHTFASGTVPERLADAIKSKVDSGVPVFLISKNPGDSHGIEKLKYQAQVTIANAGAIALKNININGTEEVLRVIQEEVSQGKKGRGVESAIIAQFGTTSK